MKITFYKNKADRIVFNKTKYLTKKGSSQNIKYKEDTDLIRPQFIVSVSDIKDKDINYVYVGKDPDNSSDTTTVNRYYYVNEITFSQQYVILSCEVDVLMSFKDDIADLEGIVERNALLYNMYLTDTKLKCFNLQRVQTFPWAASFLSDGAKTACYILTMSGGGANENNQENNQEGGE